MKHKNALNGPTAHQMQVRHVGAIGSDAGATQGVRDGLERHVDPLLFVPIVYNVPAKHDALAWPVSSLSHAQLVTR